MVRRKASLVNSAITSVITILHARYYFYFHVRTTKQCPGPQIQARTFFSRSNTEIVMETMCAELSSLTL